MSMRVTASIIFMLCLLSSCEEDLFQTSNSDTGYPGVDQRLWTYFDDFEYEARRRGYHFDLVELEITGVIENIPENGVAGTCQYGNHLSHVTVDNNYWNASSYIDREFVVFHELGHCVLSRGHSEASFQNGICQSIMASGTGSCLSAYTINNREYYLDELFANH